MQRLQEYSLTNQNSKSKNMWYENQMYKKNDMRGEENSGEACQESNEAGGRFKHLAS